MDSPDRKPGVKLLGPQVRAAKAVRYENPQGLNGP